MGCGKMSQKKTSYKKRATRSKTSGKRRRGK